MRALFFILFISTMGAHGQALRDINFSYLYDSTNPFTVKFRTSRIDAQWISFFELKLSDTSQTISNYAVQIETRKALFEKEGTELSYEPASQHASGHTLKGKVILPVTEQPVVLVAKVMSPSLKRAWYYYTVLEPKHPEITFPSSNGEPILNKFINTTDQLTFAGSTDHIVSYYDQVFPPAPLPFSEKLGRVSQGMRVDSTFVLPSGESLTLNQSGLYLLQYDTTVAEGLAIRAEEDYPRYAKVESLSHPLIYICTQQEFKRMKQAEGDKRAFDKVILSITRDTERAKILMRSYFRRVEMANRFFTSYKEGWKTDRGMIFVVFGAPDEVFKFNEREVWNYNNNLFKLSFDFAKAPSLFDPENYVLIRQQKYKQIWYEVVDLWRNARFN